jgi:uncharacterized protein YbjT (DUF2867 family)
MFLVSGATGNVGSLLVEQLLASGKRVRVFARDHGKVAHWGDRVEIAIGEFENGESFARAAADIEAAFVVNGGSDVETFKRLLSALKSHGAPRIVFLSSLLASWPGFQIGQMHLAKEDAIRQSGLHGTFLRPGAFMSNSFQWAGSIKTDGVVYNPMGTGRAAIIAPADIAAVAQKVLLSRVVLMKLSN